MRVQFEMAKGPKDLIGGSDLNAKSESRMWNKRKRPVKSTTVKMTSGSDKALSSSSSSNKGIGSFGATLV